jgi:hypothetical protein
MNAAHANTPTTIQRATSRRQNASASTASAKALAPR